MRARHAGAALVGLLIGAFAPARAVPQGLTLVETPELEALVGQGKLPPIAQRVPSEPMRGDLGSAAAPGRHGGELRMIVERARDVRLMVVYGYARLVVYALPDFRIVPDIAQAVEVESGRTFTIKLRAGHRWSDGHPFTAEDFRYFWEDVANDRQLSPTGLPSSLLVDGKPPKVTFPDAQTVRYAWDKPNPTFLSDLAGAYPLYLYRPAHYLKQFHRRYADPAQLEQRVKAASVRNWAALHNRLDNQYRNDNPDLPTLEPWVNRTAAPAQRFVFTRNPYFHRLDAAGRQLPYIDRVMLNIADGKIVPVKTGAGEADLQARHIAFDNYTFLRQASKRHDFDVDLWIPARGSHLALFPNLTATDTGWRAMLRDVRFRRALSLAINRREINQVVYFGLALESGNTALPGSPLYSEANRLAWSRYDPGAASKLLDEIGLTRRNSAGIRLMPDGRPLVLIVDMPSDSAEQTAVMQLIEDHWRRIGVKLFLKGGSVDLYRKRLFAGDSLMSMQSGAENGKPTPDMSPAEWAPTNQQHAQWSRWGNYVESAGKAGEPIDMPEGRELLDLYERWRSAAGADERRGAWQRMLAIHAEQQFTIGLVAQVPQPVVVSRRLRNVPRKAHWNFDPGAQFGIHRMDMFWFDEDGSPAGKAAGTAGARSGG
ncbi:MAG: ABC transporter substrate-binding protein [Alphaproteobacteria bacterium]|nr:ABC transporter substrate-binding protein [Alphaproteobacteria bacterium]